MCTKHARKVEFMDNLWNGVRPEAFLAEVASSRPSVASQAPSVGGGAAGRHVRSHQSAAGVLVRGVSPVSNSGGDADSEGGSDGDDDDSDDSEDTETIESEIRETRVLLDKLVEQRRTLFALLGTSSSSCSPGSGDSTTDVGTDETLLVALADAAAATTAIAAPVCAVDAMSAVNEKLKLTVEGHSGSRLSRNRVVSSDMLNCLSVLDPCLTSGPGPGLDETPACRSVDTNTQMGQIRTCLRQELGLPFGTATAIATVTATTGGASARRVRAREGEGEGEGETRAPLTLTLALALGVGVGEGESPRKRAGGLRSCLRSPSPTPSSF